MKNSLFKKLLNSIKKENNFMGNITEDNPFKNGRWTLNKLNTSFIMSLPYPAMFISRSDRRILAVNESAKKLGVKKGGYCWREFAKEQFISEIDKKIAASYPDKLPKNLKINCTFCSADKCFYSSAFQHNPEVESDGKVWDTYWIKYDENVFLHYFIDITENRKMMDSLKEHELFMKQIQQIALFGTFSFDIQTGKLYNSENIDEILGFDKKIKSLEDCLEMVTPDMKEEVTVYFAEEVLKNKKRFNKELKVYSKIKNKEHWVRVVGDIQFDENKNPVKLIGAIKDITQQKEEEAQMNRNLMFTNALLQSIPIPVFFLDANGRYLGCNEEFSNQLGVTINEIKGKTVNEIWPGDQTSKYFDSDLEILANPELKKYRTKITDKNNNERDVVLVKNVFLDEHQKVAGLVGTYIDITDHINVEEELRKSEQMLQTVLDNFPGVVFWKNAESIYLGCNSAFANGAGLENSSEIIGKTDFDLPWKETEALAYRTDDKEVIENEKVKLHIVEKQHQADGSVIWFDTNKIPFKDPEGNVIGVIGISNDITSRKAAEEQKSFLFACVENTDDRIVIKDLDFKIVGANKAWIHSKNERDLTNIFQKTETEAFNLPVNSTDVIFDKESELKAQKLPQGEFISLEKSFIQEHGKEQILLIKKYPVFDDKGVLIGTGTIETDITERKIIEDAIRESEQRYKLLADNITDGVFVSTNGKLTFVNRSFAMMLDYNESELIDKELSDFITPERRKDVQQYLSFELGIEQINNIEVECIKKDHSTILVEMFLNKLTPDKLVYGVMHDITRKRQLEERNIIKTIIQTEERERANFSKELHDGLGPLLSTIKLYLQWSTRPKSNKAFKEIILKAEDILEESIITVKEISNKLSPHLLINYGLTSAIQSFAHKLEETDTIKFTVESNLNRRIETEIEVALYRAVIECVNNTIKYANAQHIHITINDKKQHILVHYSDDGKGFDIVKTMIEKKGLGLYNLQNRIKSIGGEVMMFSTPHEGVNYNITVPVKTHETPDNKKV